MLWLAAISAQAQTYTSGPIDIAFEDTFEFLNFATIDTGYLPSQNDPISVRFHVTPVGGVVTEMEATSILEWPTAFKHTLDAIPGEGYFGIDTEVDIEFEVYINVAGVVQSSIPVWTESFGIFRFLEFDSLA